jgi:hypothetical protein
MDPDGLKLSPAAFDALVDADFDAPALPARGQHEPLFIHDLVVPPVLRNPG